jgi:hypothetical protein
MGFLTLHDRYRRAMLASLRRHPILDLDGTILTVYGRQQFAEVGYDPRKQFQRKQLVISLPNWHHKWKRLGIRIWKG